MRWQELADRGSFDAHAARAARASTPLHRGPNDRFANCHTLNTHLEALGEGAVAREVGLEPLLGLDVVAVLVLGGLASTTATRAVS